jgi:hypothetical protein
MEGRAIQDLFIIHPSVAHKEGFIGTTLRYFDPKSGTWSVTFIAKNSSVQTLTGGAVGDDRIVLLSQNKSGEGASQSRPPGENPAVRRLFSGMGVVEASRTRWFF